MGTSEDGSHDAAASPALPTPLLPFRDAGPIEDHHFTAAMVPQAVSKGPYQHQLDPFRARASETKEATPISPVIPPGLINFRMWWSDAVTSSIGISDATLPVDVAGLTHAALVWSPFVKSVLTEPEIRQADVVVADAEFDPLSFIEGKVTNTNEPIGNALTTGDNSLRFRDTTFASEAGLSRKTRRGGEFELVQRGGFQDNNSTFLIPNPQGTTRLEMNFTQPLLKDRGLAFNYTQILLAQIDVQLATNEVRADLEQHLVDVTRAYWDLYQARAEWLQLNRLLERAIDLHVVLKARGSVDSQKRQILRAEVAVTSRRSDLVRAETRIRNTQARLRVLTGDPQLLQARCWELTPQEQPLASAVNVSVRDATITALENRTDIIRALRRIQSVSVRVGAAKNQVLPRLDFLLSGYLAGLDDNSDTFGAFVNQFRAGGPSYAAGLRYEMPIGNRASRARLSRNRWELNRAIFEFQQTTEVAFADVEVAVRETRTAFDEMIAKKQAIDAALREVEYLQQRWEHLPDPGDSAVLLIENLLDAQERLTDEERAFVQAQTDYALSWVELRRTMGVLLRFGGPPIAPSMPLPNMTDPVVESIN